MKDIFLNINFWILVSVLAVFLFFIISTWFGVWYFYIRKKFYMPSNMDTQLFIRKDGRFEKDFVNLSDGKKEFMHDNQKYFVVDKCTIPDKKGKTLSLYSKGIPNPLVLQFNDTKWLDNESINSILNNELIPLLLKPKTKLQDILLFICTICCIISMFVLILVALKVFNVIKTPVPQVVKK